LPRTYSFPELSIIHWLAKPSSPIEAKELNRFAANEQSFDLHKEARSRRMVAGLRIWHKEKSSPMSTGLSTGYQHFTHSAAMFLGIRIAPNCA
jgi:hypothetical protein